MGGPKKGHRAAAYTFVMCVEWQESRLFTNVQQDADQKYTHAATKAIKETCVQLILCNKCACLILSVGTFGKNCCSAILSMKAGSNYSVMSYE